MESENFEMEDYNNGRSKQGVDQRQEVQNPAHKQGFVRDEDLAPETEDGKVMPKREVDHYAKKAESSIETKRDKLQGEGDYEAAQSYNDAATEFAQKQDDKKGERP